MSDTQQLAQPAEVGSNIDGTFHVDKDQEAEISRLLDQAEGKTSQEDEKPKTEPQTPEDEKPSDDAQGDEPEAPTSQEQEKADDEDETKVESTPTKYQKDKARKDKTWKAINEEKEALRRRDEELKAQQEAFERQRREHEQRLAEEKKPKFTANDYAQAAERYKAEGKYDLAELCEVEAKRMASMPDVNQRVAQEQAQREFQDRQTQSWSKTRAEFPEITDAQSEFRKTFETFVREKPEVFGHPDAPYMVAGMVKDKLQARQVPGLMDELKSLRERVQELEKSTSIPDDAKAPSTPRGEVPFHMLPTEDMEKRLKREIMEARGE